MNLLSILSVAWIYSSYCAASSDAQNLQRRDSTCSLGIGRQFATTIWDATVYNVPQAQRQDFDIIGTLRNAPMDKGQNLTLTSTSIPAITITNIDNAVVFDYDTQDLNASISDVNTGKTKVRLSFELAGGAKWTTDNCTAGSVVISAGRESWSCEFACPLSSAKEL